MTQTFVDAGILIAAGRRLGPRGGTALALLSDPAREFVSSRFVRLEVMPKAIYHRNQDEISCCQEFFDQVMAWAEPVDQILVRAESVAERNGLNAVDALHLAAAFILGAEEGDDGRITQAAAPGHRHQDCRDLTCLRTRRWPQNQIASSSGKGSRSTT